MADGLVLTHAVPVQKRVRGMTTKSSVRGDYDPYANFRQEAN
jgi:hypothetical protein